MRLPNLRLNRNNDDEQARPARPTPQARGRQEEEPELTIESMEQQASEEVSAVLKGFRERARQEQSRKTDVLDSEYWLAVCFQTREQKEEFLSKLGAVDLGDKYIDGMQLAQLLGITLESRVPPMPKLKTDRRLRELSE